MYRNIITVVSPRADTGIGPYAVRMGERFAGGSDVFKGSTEVATVKTVILKHSTMVGDGKMVILEASTTVDDGKMTVLRVKTTVFRGKWSF